MFAVPVKWKWMPYCYMTINVCWNAFQEYIWHPFTWQASFSQTPRSSPGHHRPHLLHGSSHPLPRLSTSLPDWSSHVAAAMFHAQLQGYSNNKRKKKRKKKYGRKRKLDTNTKKVYHMVQHNFRYWNGQHRHHYTVDVISAQTIVQFHLIPFLVYSIF